MEPFAWLKDVLERIATHPVNRLEELQPAHWKQAQTKRQEPAADQTLSDN
ncbi:MAG: transposase domain-containing protein [Bacteroidetes bacterium]|nr:MAG: transposase domain-containing protein [Bacteroidota bacterium]